MLSTQFEISSTGLSDLRDGTSHVFLVGEKHVPESKFGQSGPWHCRFGSHHPGCCHFAFADGHVATLNVTTDIDVLHKLAVRNDGKPVEDF